MELSVETMRSKGTLANAACLELRTLCCSCRNSRSAGSLGSRHRRALNMHMPAPVGSADIFTALRSRNRTNEPSSASTRRNSASETPLRFEVGLWSRRMPGVYWPRAAYMLHGPCRATKLLPASSCVVTTSANSSAAFRFSADTRGLGIVRNAVCRDAGFSFRGRPWRCDEAASPFHLKIATTQRRYYCAKFLSTRY